MQKIRMKHIRNLGDTGLQTLAPITLLVGENGSGKSTFLRTFPLVRQSLSKKISGPLLWAGDVDDYVDFGSFEETVTTVDGKAEREMEFTFVFSMPQTNMGLTALLGTDAEKKRLNVEYKITITKERERDLVSKAAITVESTRVELDFTGRSCKVDGVLLSNAVRRTSGKEAVSFYDIDRESIFGFALPALSESEKAVRVKEAENGIRPFPLLSLLGGWLICGKSYQELKEKWREKGIAKKMGFYRRYLEEGDGAIGAIEKQYQIAHPWFEPFAKCLYVYEVFDEIEEFLAEYYENVHYIAPVRATAERYYRRRNYAIEEIDYRGKNLPIFLDSLSETRLKDFQNWTEEYFGFAVMVKRSEGYVSLCIRLNDSDSDINLSDTGFGYSQILPVITQLWDLSTKNSEEESTRRRGAPFRIGYGAPVVLAIEQPELHLHPAMQAKLAKAFIAAVALAEKNGVELQILLETHSETMVNCFGAAVEETLLAAQDINVILFTKNAKTKLTEVSSSRYDENGYLENWPIGFFAAED